jgi:hypothetical protein
MLKDKIKKKFIKKKTQKITRVKLRLICQTRDQSHKTRINS